MFWFTLKGGSQEMALQLYAEGFNLPVDISKAGDNRLFITEKGGTIRILNVDGSRPTTPFLDIKTRVNASANERGLLGLCFHPNYKMNGYFFVHYTNLSGHTTISRFSTTEDVNKADPNSEKIILVINQPYNNHNGGDLEFGPDGYLYIGMGDGGSANDPGNRSQNPTNLLGKMLRIDINTEETYTIPADNPWFGHTDTLPEIWSLGLRNPWRFSFDKLTGDLWIGDVGQNKWEEINFVPRGTAAINYGWKCYEGFDTHLNQGCLDMSHYTPPVFTYRNPTIGCSVTGGYVYRGNQASRYLGHYIFADYCSGRFWSVFPDSILPFSGKELGKFSTDEYVTFGEDMEGNLYVAAIRAGRIFKFVDPKCTRWEETLDMDISTSVSCRDSCDGFITLNIQEDHLKYQWNTGDTLNQLSGLCPGTYSLALTDSIGCFKNYSWTIDSVAELTLDLNIAGQFLQVFANQMVTYQWYKDGEIIEGATDSIFMVKESAEYYVVVTNLNGCSTQSFSVLITSDQTVEIPKPYLMVITPGGGELSFAFSEDLISNLTLFDIQGRALYQEQGLYLKNNWKKIAISGIQKGNYFVSYFIDNQLYTNKIIIR